MRGQQSPRVSDSLLDDHTFRFGPSRQLVAAVSFRLLRCVLFSHFSRDGKSNYMEGLMYVHPHLTFMRFPVS